jgi:hypothetical protein
MKDQRNREPLLPPWAWASVITTCAFVALALHIVFASTAPPPIPKPTFTPEPTPSSPLTVIVGPHASP